MSKIPIHLLNSFVVFGDANTISDAAGILGITQPALSKQLKLMEELLPHPLFSYSGRNKVLTPFGRELHGKLKERLGNLDGVIEQTNILFADAERARLRVVGRRGILDRISQKTEFPGYLEFTEASNNQVVQELMARKAEIGVTHSRPSNHELIARPLFREKFSIAVPKKLKAHHSVYGKKLFSELAGFPCVGFKRDDEILGRLCELNSIEFSALKMVRSTSDYASIAKIVEAGLGWAVLPAYLPINKSLARIVPIPSEAFDVREFYLLYRKEFATVPWFKKLVAEIMRCF